MVRIAPINLYYNPKTLWFDAGDLDVRAGDGVIVSTARGTEFGRAAHDVFEADEAQIKKLKSPLKPVKRIATDEDEARAAELEAKSREALPVFKEMAAEGNGDMHPVSVEYLFEGDKAIFYFEAEERVDFRELVRKLAACAMRPAWWAAWGIAARSCAASAWAASSAPCPSAWRRSRTSR